MDWLLDDIGKLLISLGVSVAWSSCQSDPYQFRAASQSHARGNDGQSWICFKNLPGWEYR